MLYYINAVPVVDAHIKYCKCGPQASACSKHLATEPLRVDR